MPDVAILCGGLGTRLRAVVADRPKALAIVSGRPFLAWLLDALALAGFTRAVLCTGYQAEQIEATFGAVYHGLHLSYSAEPSLVGTGGALRHALPLLHSATIAIVNGDSYCQADLAGFWQGHVRSRAAASMVLTRVEDSSRFGSVEVNHGGWISAFHEKSASAGPGWINAGIYLARRALLEAIPSGQVCSLERDVFPGWIKGGLRGVKTDGFFIDIGTPESYVRANRLFGQLSDTRLEAPTALTAALNQAQ